MVWGWLRLKPAAHRFAAALNISHRFRKREFPARYYISRFRQRYETKHDCILPHPGSLQDVGSTLSHKTQAVRKVIFERKDPAAVAREINHTQSSVDRYLRDYHRVKTLHAVNPDPVFIHQCTNIAKHVVRQYIKLIEEQKQLDEKKSDKQD